MGKKEEVVAMEVEAAAPAEKKKKIKEGEKGKEG